MDPMRIMVFGFVAAYLAFMGFLVVLNAPILDPYSASIMSFLLLPLALIGLCAIGYAKFRPR
jgi:hypothetical protein